MKYISRRISVKNQHGEEIEYTDADFFGSNAPLIILGEPGAGKSELLRFANEKYETRIYKASAVGALPVFDDQSNVIIVDGIDEITAYATGTPINNILVKLPQTSLFVLSCRAADWQDTINTGIINQKWQQQPIVGRVMPLNEQEIIDFVDANGEGQNGDEFLKEARQRDVVDLLRNPQNLLLLLKVVKSKGWPATRLELYENASLELIKEDNDDHSSINRTRPASEQLIEAAGFICAQLLLSGKASISLDGQGDGEYPKASELTSVDIEYDVIQSALSTKLFRVTGQNLLEPCHRTVAEFLAAKWISKALQQQLSLKRIENILYGSSYIVPAALRGLHAWIATLNLSLADKFIERDPYGFFRYGDPTVLTILQAQRLLSSLEKVADTDPYFRSEDWHATFGKGLARIELCDDIIRVIRNSSSYQLSHLIMESIQGDAFADEIASELLAIVTDNTATPLERHAAVNVLAECNNKPNWNDLVVNLKKIHGFESLRIALEIVQDQIDLFCGKTLAEILVELASVGDEDDSSSYIGLGYGLQRKLSLVQLEDGLDVLSEALIEKEKKGHVKSGDLEGWLHKFMQERFERGSMPIAKTVWSWLKNLKRYSSYQKSNWDKYSVEFFAQNVQYRRALQAEALKSFDNIDDLWLGFFHIRDISPGLWIGEDDLIFHLSNLIKEKDLYPDWDQRWKLLVRWGQVHSDFTGTFMDFARNQASQSDILSSHLKELEKPPEVDWEKETEERQRKYRLKQEKKKLVRHQSVAKIQTELMTGKHLNALSAVANAYLGRFSDFKEIGNPTNRVIELVGSKMAAVAFEGLNVVIARDEIPTARQIIELHAKKNNRYYVEDILLAHCDMRIRNSRDLADLPIDIVCSALAACHWNLDFGDDITSSLREQLEEIVFADKAVKEAFVRDTIEPYLNSNTEHVSGLYRLSHEDVFIDIVGLLAIEWIEKFVQLSNKSLWELLYAAIRYSSRDRLIELIRDRISNEKWNDEEQRNIWLSMAFLLDFDNSYELLTSFAVEKKDHLWSLREMYKPQQEGWPKLNSAQHNFLIINFSSSWPPVDSPSGGWGGDNNPWDASRFIQDRITDLATDLSDQAEEMLRNLLDSKGVEGYQDHIKHVYAQQTRNRVEEKNELLSIIEVRKILLQGEPSNHDDLQALVMDELAELQDRIRNSSTNDILPFWNGDIPYDENYCRDRIASALNLSLGHYNIRAHTEGTMPDNKRCDLLITHGQMDVPIEIKGQWHSEIWTAAEEQLQNYTNEYRAKGRGIYLVLWFGYLGVSHQKNPRGWNDQDLPKTLDEMKSLLKIKYANVSETTKIIVLDLSK
jgi:hypothetical protein